MAMRLSFAGLITGPLAWAVSLQGNYVMAGLQCRSTLQPTAWAAFALAVVALGGGYLSYQALQHARADPANLPRHPRTERFVAGVGVLTAGIFALGILLQAFAGLVFTGCER